MTSGTAVYFASDTPILDTGGIRNPPPGGRWLLWPAWCWRVLVPDLAERRLNPFTRVIAQLCQAGITRPGDMAELTQPAPGPLQSDPAHAQAAEPGGPRREPDQARRRRARRRCVGRVDAAAHARVPAPVRRALPAATLAGHVTGARIRARRLPGQRAAATAPGLSPGLSALRAGHGSGTQCQPTTQADRGRDHHRREASPGAGHAGRRPGSDRRNGPGSRAGADGRPDQARLLHRRSAGSGAAAGLPPPAGRRGHQR